MVTHIYHIPFTGGMSEATTTIKVSKSNRDALAKRGSKDESFDEIIARLLNQTEASA
jgi:hypothetical protein